MLLAVIGTLTTLYLESMNTRVDRIDDSIVRVEQAVLEDRGELREVLISYEHRFTLLESRHE